MQFDFTEQTAIVTGGTRGIGRAISEAFLNGGANVVATFRSNQSEAHAFLAANSSQTGKLEV